MSNEEILNLYRVGDPNALEELYNNNFQMIKKLLLRLITPSTPILKTKNMTQIKGLYLQNLKKINATDLLVSMRMKNVLTMDLNIPVLGRD